MLIQGNFPISVFTDCKYTCHRRCKEDVDLDCTGGWLYERMMSVDEVTMKTLHLVDQVMSSLLSGKCGLSACAAVYKLSLHVHMFFVTV